MTYNYNIIQFCPFSQTSPVRKFANLGHQNDTVSKRIYIERSVLVLYLKVVHNNLCYARNFERLCPKVTGPMKYKIMKLSVLSHLYTLVVVLREPLTCHNIMTI